VKKLIAIAAAAAVLGGSAALTVGAAAAPTTAPACVASQLGVRANGTNGAAGTIYGAWVFTNLTKRTCSLFGYPGMRLYGRAGRPMRTIVRRDLAPGPRGVTLGPGGSATFRSSYSDVSSGRSPCRMSAVAQITAPGAFTSLFIPAQLGPCHGVVHVSAVEPGVHRA
jgi:hypothetical protein